MNQIVKLLENCAELYDKAPGKVDDELKALHAQATEKQSSSGDRKQKIISTLRSLSFEVLDYCVCIAEAVIPRIWAKLRYETFIGPYSNEIVENAIIGFALTMSLNGGRKDRDTFFKFISRKRLFCAIFYVIVFLKQNYCVAECLKFIRAQYHFGSSSQFNALINTVSEKMFDTDFFSLLDGTSFSRHYKIITQCIHQILKLQQQRV